MVLNKWRIGLTEGGKAWFVSLELPPPNTAPFSERVESVPYSLGKFAEIGYQSIPIGFNDLTGTQMYRLRKYVDDARQNNSQVLHMTIWLATGEKSGVNWADISGYVSPITYSSITPVANGSMYQNVEIIINNVTVINDPAQFS